MALPPNIDLHASAPARFARWRIWCAASSLTKRWTSCSYMPQRGARMLEKVIKSAMGNAEIAERIGDLDELVLTEARIDQGPMFKRVRPRARGMAFMIKKRMAHIQVSVGSV